MNRLSVVMCAAALAVVLAMAAGCALKATRLSDLQVGMNYNQVRKELGPPEHVKSVRFKGHERDFLVWEYLMVPQHQPCPSDAVARSLAGLATLGLSEIAVSHIKAQPHWIYFLDGRLVYTSRAIECEQPGCQAKMVEVGEVSRQ